MKVRLPRTWALMLTLGAGACGSDGGPAQTTVVEQPVANQAPTPKKGKEGAEEPTFTYNPVGKRDPFRSYLADLKEQEDTSSRPLQETEKFELDQYRLTGVVHGTSQPKGMVEDPEGVGHTLRVGSRLGRNGGRVTRISATGIVVVEEFVDPLGKRVRVPITMKLPEDAKLNIQTQ